LACQRTKKQRLAAVFFASDLRRLLGQHVILCHQHVFGFNIVDIVGNAIDRADFAALRRIKMSDTFGTFIGIDFVNFVAL
jgi:hypothetical protein